MAEVKADMAGILVTYLVKPGDTIISGQEVATIESMKMQINLASPRAGRVARILVEPGSFVNEGDALLELTP